MTTAERSPRVRILVVNNEALITDLLADMPSPEGHEVDTAPGWLAALRRLGAREYDLVLSDLRMPGLDGPGLYRELEGRRPDLLRRLVFVTDTMEAPEYRAFLSETRGSALSKPFGMADLHRLIRELLVQS
jgi:CheY-like chemotaxis protein